MTLDLDPIERESLIRRCWYSHDALWFRTVSDALGIDAANRLNRATLRNQGRIEARRLLRALGIETARSIDDMLHLLRAGCCELLVTPPDIEAVFSAVDDHSYEVRVERCFVHERVVRSGFADRYDCAVFDRFFGWHAGAGLPLATEPDTERCRMACGRPCVRRLTIQQEKPDGLRSE